MKEIERKDTPEVSGGVAPPDGGGVCSEPPGWPGIPELPYPRSPGIPGPEVPYFDTL